ncbi:hypothetical protein EI94DRAFT_1702771 [Lactarius quietus]|nr:hypothetical protein EI94DRAFT_1702771 [Lactarius quietus]
MVTVVMIIVVGFVVMVVIGWGQGPVWCVAVLYMLEKCTLRQQEKEGESLTTSLAQFMMLKIAKVGGSGIWGMWLSKGNKGCHEALIAILGLTKAIHQQWKKQKGKGLMNDFGGHDEGEDKKDTRLLRSDPTLGRRQRKCLHEHWKNCHDYPEAHTWESRAEKDIEEEAARALVAAENDSYLAYDEACKVRQLSHRCWQEGYSRTNEGHVTRSCDEVPDHEAGLRYKSWDVRMEEQSWVIVWDYDVKVAIGIGGRQLCPKDDQRRQTAIVWCKTRGLNAGRTQRATPCSWDALQRAGFDPLSGKESQTVLKAESLFSVTILVANLIVRRCHLKPRKTHWIQVGSTFSGNVTEAAFVGITVWLCKFIVVAILCHKVAEVGEGERRRSHLVLSGTHD